VFAELPPLRIDHGAGPNEVGSVLGQERAVVRARDETDLLRVGLARHRQSQSFGLGPRLLLGLPADREQGSRELLLAHHVQHVGLIFRTVQPPAQMPRTRGVLPGPNVVARGDEVEPAVVRPVQEGPELDVLVAPDARVGRSTRAMLTVEVVQDGAFELGAHVHDLEREPADLRHRSGVGLGLWAAAAVVHAVQMDKLEVRAHDAVALLVEQGGGDGGIDPAAHRDQHGCPLRHGGSSLAAATDSA